MIGDKPLNEVAINDIGLFLTNILKQATKKSNTTRGDKAAIKHTIMYIRQIFNFVKRKGLITDNPASNIVSLGEAGTRDRVLSFQEIWRFWYSVEECTLPSRQRP